MKMKQILAVATVGIASLTLGGAAEALTPTELFVDCFNASAMYGIRANQNFGFAPSYVQTWWSANGCGTSHNATDQTTCSRIANTYGVSANSTWGYAPANVQQWWTAHGCTATTSLSACQAAANHYAIVANQSFNLAPQFVKDFWGANNCNQSFQGAEFGVTACSTASFYYRIYANDTFGWAPADATATSIDVQQWWVDNNCATSP